MNRLKEILKEKGMTFRELSIKTEIQEGYLNRVANGHSNPGLKYAIKIADALGVTLDCLIGENESDEGTTDPSKRK